jgi:hypothetical protein
VEDYFNRLFASKLVILLIGGVVMLVVSRIIKRGRLAEEHPSAGERLLWAIGILATISALLVAGFRSDLMDVPKKDDTQLGEYEREPSGCSKREKGIKDYNQSP